MYLLHICEVQVSVTLKSIITEDWTMNTENQESIWYHNMGGYKMINIAFAGTEKGHCMLDSFCLGL